MRIAEATDAIRLMAVYQEAVSHANKIGKIDWPDPIPASFISDLIATGELYCFETENNIVAAAKLSDSPDERVWGDDAALALYLAKLATSDNVRNHDYFRSSMLPLIAEKAGNAARLRLDCLADNDRLKKFYQGLGFVDVGNIAFFSEKQQRVIVVTRFERSAEF